MFNKGPDLLFNAVFNVPQGLVMTVAVSLYQGIADPVSLLQTFVCAYCAGVMLTLFVRVPAAGAWVSQRLRCAGHPVADYIVSNAAGGAIMGVLMNFFMTWMAIGPVSYFPAAYLHCLGISVGVSAVSSCCWIGLTQLLVKRVHGEKPE